MNVLTKSIATTITALATLAAANLHAETLPIAEDTFGTISKGTILSANGAAKGIIISAKTKAYIGFDVAGSGISSSAVTNARLTIYVAKAKNTGTLFLANAVADFAETFTAKSIPMPGDVVIASTPAGPEINREFVTFDVTSQVKDWLDNPSSEHGFVLTADGTLAVTIATKEGAGSGHPAILEVDVANSVLNGGTVQLQTSGGTFQFGSSEGVADLDMSGGGLPGFLRFRNALEIWPSADGMTAGVLDIRNTFGNGTISLNGGSGTGTFTGNVTAGSVSAGSFSGGSLSLSGQASADSHASTNANGSLFLFGGFSGGGSGTTLMGILTGTNAGPQLRFQNSGSGSFIDIGQDGSNNFIIENSDNRAFSITANGKATFGNIAPNSGYTFQIEHARNAANSQDTPFLISSNSGLAVLWMRTFAPGGPINFELFEGDAFKPGGGSWGVVSDARLKKNIHDLDSSLEKLLTLRPVTYEYIDPKRNGQAPGIHTGFIAQEVEKVFPEWVSNLPDGYKGVTIKGFESLTVKALGELREEKDAQIATLKAENAALRKQLAENEARDRALEARLARLETAAPASTATTTAPVASNGAIEIK